MHASPHVPQPPPPSSQGRNIFSTFLLTFRAVYMFPGPNLEFIYLKVSFHSVRKKERETKSGGIERWGWYTEMDRNQHSEHSDLAIGYIKMHPFLQEILVNERKTKHQRYQVRESSLCNKYTCPLLGTLKKHTLASSTLKAHEEIPLNSLHKCWMHLKSNVFFIIYPLCSLSLCGVIAQAACCSICNALPSYSCHAVVLLSRFF